MSSVLRTQSHFKRLLVLYFNKKRKLKKLDKFDLNDGKYVDFSTDNTSLQDKEESLLSSIFSNVGIGGVRALDFPG